jgi:hypothetical protein
MWSAAVPLFVAAQNALPFQRANSSCRATQFGPQACAPPRSEARTASSSAWVISGQRRKPTDLLLGGRDLIPSEVDARAGIRDVALEAVDRIRGDARNERALWRDDLLLAQLDDPLFDIVDVLAQALDLLLALDHGHVRDDAEGGIEQIVDLALAILARLGPQRPYHEIVVRRQLARLAAIARGVVEDAVDRLHEALRLLVEGIALARVTRRRLGLGWFGRLRGRRRRLCFARRPLDAVHARARLSALLLDDLGDAVARRLRRHGKRPAARCRH